VREAPGLFRFGPPLLREISTFYPQPAGALPVALSTVDTGAFHSRCRQFSTVNPQAFPAVTHRLCTNCPDPAAGRSGTRAVGAWL